MNYWSNNKVRIFYKNKAS